MTDSGERRSHASLEEVASAAGVSKMTVSRVLRGAKGFSEDTRVRVLREVERLGYLPNRLAAAFGTGEASTLVGVCVPRLTSSLFGEVLQSVNRTLARFGYQTMIGSHDNLPEEEERWLRGLLSWRPAGVMLSSRQHSPATVNLLRNAGIPIVEFWDLNTSPLDLSVGFNHVDCGYEMGQYFVARGRRKIGYVGALSGSRTMAGERLQGFKDALSGAGLELHGSEIVADQPAFYAGYYATETLLNRTGDIDALYYHEDSMAIGGLAYCNANGISVPGDIGIAGWGGIEAASILPQRLTTTDVPTHQLGKQSAEALVSHLRNEPVLDVSFVPARLVPGGTI